ncbi:MAG: YbaN family protein [Gemmataceae bacterium]|nr:YbaN family protein [Gemmata sp.]MDW8196234.1 YbaN family protein [Gemmataceae bacterium]
MKGSEIPQVVVTPSPSTPPRATGVKRLLLVVAGLASVGMAYLGAILPGLPTTPWVLLASYCFARSSPRLQRWLKRSPVFGRLLHDWEEHRGIRKPVKVFAVVVVVVVVTLSIALSSLPVWVKCVIGGLALVGISVIVFVVPTIRTPGGAGGGEAGTCRSTPPGMAPGGADTSA